jgi:SAM-dependent methyltransferase
MSDYHDIVAHYEACLEAHGDTHLGVDWPKEADVFKRYAVMLDVIREEGHQVRLLDFGCGASHLYGYMQQAGYSGVDYAGLDLSEKFIALCRSKYPENAYYCLDILQDSEGLPEFDYIVMNGVFTEKRSLNFDAMLEYFKDMIRAVYAKAREGLVFNVMSKQVDWEREDLFHLPLDTLADFLAGEVSRNFVIRNDYGLYEYSVYVYRHPLRV